MMLLAVTCVPVQPDLLGRIVTLVSARKILSTLNTHCVLSVGQVFFFFFFLCKS